MSCFWTDLVGATQSGCEATAGLRLAIGGIALETATPATVSTMASAFLAQYTGLQAGVDGNPAMIGVLDLGTGFGTGATFNNVSDADLDYTSTNTFSAGFTAQTGRVITTYAEFLVPGALTVAGCWTIEYDGCGAPLTTATVTSRSTTGASAAIDGSGFLEVTPPSSWGSPGGSYIDYVMRITGTINGDNGSTAAADFYLFGSYDGCI